MALQAQAIRLPTALEVGRRKAAAMLNFVESLAIQ
jgi:hypothetical protein